SQKQVFRSRISVLLIVFLSAIFILPCTIPMVKHMMIFGLSIMGVVLLLVLLLYGGMRYIILGERLYLRIWSIPTCSFRIADIVSMKRSYYIFDIPTNTTASFKKLRLQFAGEIRLYVHVSPVREKEFVEALKAINPNIQVNIPEKTGRWWRIWDWDI
ncbi:MAG: hypothetical protein FWE30_05585, partial [Bacteroidales bacterium]|nr:hypothetical protein [Bacteroidales bacterium]